MQVPFLSQKGSFYSNGRLHGPYFMVELIYIPDKRSTMNRNYTIFIRRSYYGMRIEDRLYLYISMFQAW